jgi:hypothetical protein
VVVVDRTISLQEQYLGFESATRSPEYEEQAMYQWRNFARSAENEAKPFLETNGPTARRKGVLGALLNSLHDSRHLQARRVIHEYRHLIAEGGSFRAPDRICEGVPEGKSDKAISNDSRAQRSSTSLKLWIAVTAAGFGILHVAGGLMLHTSNSQPTETSQAAIHYD